MTLIPAGKKKRWLALDFVVLMIVGATIGELPVTKEMFPDIKLDMFFLCLSPPLLWRGRTCSLPVNTQNTFRGIS